MNRRKFLFELLYILLAACLCIACIRLLPEHEPVTMPDTSVPVTEPVTRLDLSGTSVESLSLFDAYPGLTYLNLTGTGVTAEQYEVLREKYPECEIIWELPFQDKTYPLDTTSLTFATLTDEEVDALDHLPLLSSVFAWDCKDFPQLLALQEQHPQCTIYYTVDTPNTSYDSRTTHIETTGDDPESLAEVIPYLPQLSSVTLTTPLAEGSRLKALVDAFPDVEFHWELTYQDMTIGTATTELDLSRIPLTLEEVESILPYMPNLTRLDLSHCGISNEELDALNRRYEDVKIVWTVYIASLALKTDATSFMPGKFYVEVFTNDVYNLRYCTDMECLDLGHMKITNCDFVAFMPKLKYLMLADTRITDLTPLTGLTELKYLELFMSPVTDYTPLTTLTALEDLNLYFTYGDPEPLHQMTWLNNLWWRSWEATDAEIQALTAALPDTHVECRYAGSTTNGWRQLPNYYAQRDIFGMEYMTE